MRTAEHGRSDRRVQHLRRSAGCRIMNCESNTEGHVERPRLKAHFTATVVDGTKVFLVAEDQHYLVRGAGPVAVLLYLDGRHTVAEIAMELSSSRSLPEVLLAVRRYQAAGHLADGRPDLPEPALAHWDALGLDAAE